MSMNFKRHLPMAKETREEMPLSADLAAKKVAFDAEVAAVMRGEDPRRLLIIGPCSADREDSVLDYMHRLARVADEVKDKLIVIPRVYTNKETGFFTADEMLYPTNYQYLVDLLSYVAVGARSVENQEHRLVAAGINVPVGMKNPTAGSTSVMLNSIYAAQAHQSFIYRGWEVECDGNPLAHAVLRGYIGLDGRTYPNYHYEHLERLAGRYLDADFANPSVVVDCNHDNSGKRPLEQPRICREVLESCARNDLVRRMVKGFMVESYLEDGNQPVDGGVYGKSITDACLGWEKTERLVRDIAERV